MFAETTDERFASMQELRTELLKNYPNRLESEATLTYEKVDAVGAVKNKPETIKAEASKTEDTRPQAGKPMSPSTTLRSAMGSAIGSTIRPTSAPKQSKKTINLGKIISKATVTSSSFSSALGRRSSSRYILLLPESKECSPEQCCQDKYQFWYQF